MKLKFSLRCVYAFGGRKLLFETYNTVAQGCCMTYFSLVTGFGPIRL